MMAQSRTLLIEETELPEMVLSGWLADVVQGFLAGYAAAQLVCSGSSSC